MCKQTDEYLHCVSTFPLPFYALRFAPPIPLTTPHFPLFTFHFSLMPQRLDGIQLGGFVRRIEPEEDAHRSRRGECQ
jgi:hypothetical protein